MLSDEAWAAIEPLIPMDRRGVKPRRNRQVIGGIVFVLRSGCPWAACPAEYAPAKTVYNRFARWSRDGVWQRMADASVRLDAVDVQSVDSTSVKAVPLTVTAIYGVRKMLVMPSRSRTRRRQ